MPSRPGYENVIWGGVHLLARVAAGACLRFTQPAGRAAQTIDPSGTRDSLRHHNQPEPMEATKDSGNSGH
ncbi:MAG TPA: hypothetical protein VGP04_08180, partial [Pseudonocardiaceae bacterium]|nr:hypothetical protein [Pseudonocardiaceae bacterium]